jgi:hypothetical protein
MSSNWSEAMSQESMLHDQWLLIQERLHTKRLLEGPEASLSLRIPGSEAMWFGTVSDLRAQRRSWQGMGMSDGHAGLHAAIYSQREDVGAIAVGGGEFGTCLADFGGSMPGVFDEQVRHLGCMGQMADAAKDLVRSLRDGGNALLVRGRPVCMGMTGARLALNAELFEKCAKAYVLAVATGGPVKSLPWVVRTVANRRLMKDERRAAGRFALGLLPEESKGY